MVTTPKALRRSVDRRIRIRVATTAAVAALLVTGTAIGAQAVLNAEGPPPPGPDTSQVSNPTEKRTRAASPEPLPTSSPTMTPPPAPAAIPDRAFLQRTDLNIESGDYSLDERPGRPLPALCGAKYRSDSAINARRTVHLNYKEKRRPDYIPDGSFDQTITTYHGDGGVQFMAQIKEAVAACPVETRDGTTYRNRLVAGSIHGDESILIEIRYPARDYATGEPAGHDEIRLISVVRVGGVVMILWERGYESTSSKRTTLDAYTGTALTRLRSWLD